MNDPMPDILLDIKNWGDVESWFHRPVEFIIDPDPREPKPSRLFLKHFGDETPYPEFCFSPEGSFLMQNRTIAGFLGELLRSRYEARVAAERVTFRPPKGKRWHRVKCGPDEAYTIRGYTMLDLLCLRFGTTVHMYLQINYEDRMLEQFLSRYMYDPGKHSVLDLWVTPSEPTSLKGLYEHTAQVQGADGTLIAKRWMKHPERQTYEGAVH